MISFNKYLAKKSLTGLREKMLAHKSLKVSQLIFVVVLLFISTRRWSSSLALVKLGDDGLDDVLHLLLLGLEVLGLSLLRKYFS